MAKQTSAEKEARWREIVERQAGSGLSIRGFCADEGISEPSFYAWRKKLRQRQDGGRRARQPKGREEFGADAGLFVPLQLVDTVSTLEIIHPLGYRIQVTGNVDRVALRQVIEALDDRGAR